jgi:hypothetical protein
MRVHALFGEMTLLIRRINIVRQAAEAPALALSDNDTLRKRLEQLEMKADAIRKQIVATKEGGAITGEERLREHTNLLYGAIMSWEGRPTAYQLARIDVLDAELAKIRDQFDNFIKNDLPIVNDELTDRGLPRVDVPDVVAEVEHGMHSVGAQSELRAALSLH